MHPSIRKVLRITGGFLLLIAGGVLSLPGVPGPGIVLILLGLALLSEHFVWAQKSLAWVKEKYERIKRKVSGQKEPVQEEQ